jgi:hypothetical protein
MTQIKECCSLHRTTRFIVAFVGGSNTHHQHHPEAVAYALGAERVEYAPLLQPSGPSSNGCALFYVVKPEEAAGSQIKTIQDDDRMWCVRVCVCVLALI